MLNLEDVILTTLEDIGMGPDYHPFLELHSETFSNLESNVKEALEKLKKYLK